MPITLRDYLAELPADERSAVEARARELIAEEASLREIRTIAGRSQEQLAGKLGLQQAAISRLERRSDWRVGTLRKYVEALGGELDLLVRLPRRRPVRLALVAKAKGKRGSRSR